MFLMKVLQFSLLLTLGAMHMSQIADAATKQKSTPKILVPTHWYCTTNNTIHTHTYTQILHTNLAWTSFTQAKGFDFGILVARYFKWFI